MPPTVQEALQDPNFLGLPIPEKIKGLAAIDPSFAGLDPGEQMKAVLMLHGKSLQAAAPIQSEQSMFRDPAGYFKIPGPVDVAMPILGAVGRGISAAGEFAGEGVRKLTEPIATIPKSRIGAEVGADVSAGLGAAANTATQYYGPGLAMRGLQGVAKVIAPRLPGAQSALHEMATASLEALPGKFAGAIPKEQLYQAAESAGMNVSSNKISSTIDSLLAREATHAKAAQAAPYVNFLQEMKVKIAENPNLSFKDFEALTQDTNQVMHTMEARTNQRAFAGLNELHGAALDDLKTASANGGYPAGTLAMGKPIAPSPAGDLFMQAQKQAQRDFATNRLESIITRAKTPLAGQEGLEKVNYGSVLKQVKNDKLLNRAYTPDEIKGITDLLNEYRNIPIVPPPKGGQFGFGRAATIASGAAGAGMALGGIHAAEVAGTIAPAIDHIIAVTLSSQTGRGLLKQLLNSGPLNQTKINVLTAFARATTGENFKQQSTGQ